MVKHWATLLESFVNQPISLWDTSYYSDHPFNLDFFRKDSKGGTVVILDNAFYSHSVQHFSTSLRDNGILCRYLYDHTNLIIVSDTEQSTLIEQPEYTNPMEMTGLASG